MGGSWEGSWGGGWGVGCPNIRQYILCTVNQNFLHEDIEATKSTLTVFIKERMHSTVTQEIAQILSF